MEKESKIPSSLLARYTDEPGIIERIYSGGGNINDLNIMAELLNYSAAEGSSLGEIIPILKQLASEPGDVGKTATKMYTEQKRLNVKLFPDLF